MSFALIRLRQMLLAALCCFPVCALALTTAAPCAKPAWPEESLRKGQEGTVRLAVTVAADGSVSDTKLLATSFFPLLDEATRAAMALCRFVPATENGVAAESTFETGYPWKQQRKRRAPFADAPPAMRAFLEQARQADAIRDPVQRCLAFPDDPSGQRRPDGSAKKCAAPGSTSFTKAQLTGLAVFAQPGAEIDEKHRAAAWAELVRLLALYRHADDSYVAALIRGRLLLDLAKDPAWALPSLQRAVSLVPDDLDAQYLLGEAHFKLGNYGQAEPLLTAALAEPALNDTALYQLILAAFDQAQWDKAVDRAMAFTAAYPEQRSGWYSLGYAKMRRGDEAGALDAYRALIRVAGLRQDHLFSEQIARARRYLDGERDPAFTGGPARPPGGDEH